MALETQLNQALQKIESLPLSDSELLAMPLYILLSGTSAPNPDQEASPESLGAILQQVLLERQKKGVGFNHTLLCALLESWKVPLIPAFSAQTPSTFFLGSSL